MNSDQETPTSINSTPGAMYYLILDDVAKLTDLVASDVSSDELSEIEQIGRLVLEVTDDRPVFMTST
jgi:hypothetical protein